MLKGNNWSGGRRTERNNIGSYTNSVKEIPLTLPDWDLESPSKRMSSDSGSGSSDSSEDIFAVEDEVKSRACAKKGTPSTRGKKQEAFSSQSVVVDVDSDWVVEDSGSDADLQQAIANSLGEKAMDGGGARSKEKRAALVGAPKLPKVTASKKGAGRKQVPPPDDEDGSTKPRTGECWMCKVSQRESVVYWYSI